MTHDELLARIGRLSKNASLVDATGWSALRAVVELHKPETVEFLDKTVCITCSFDIDLYAYYPCDTI